MSPLSPIPHTPPLLGSFATAGVAGGSPSAGAIPLAELKSLSTGSATEVLPPSEAGWVPPGCASGPAVGTQPGQSFSSVLGHLINEVNAKQAAATETVQNLQSGQNVPLHQAVIAMEEASVSFQLMVEVRNKLLESYQELMRMQI